MRPNPCVYRPSRQRIRSRAASVWSAIRSSFPVSRQSLRSFPVPSYRITCREEIVHVTEDAPQERWWSNCMAITGSHWHGAKLSLTVLKSRPPKERFCCAQAAFFSPPCEGGAGGVGQTASACSVY